jgi:hypothetical protein
MKTSHLPRSKNIPSDEPVQAAGVYLNWYMKIGIVLFPFSCDVMFVGL